MTITPEDILAVGKKPATIGTVTGSLPNIVTPKPTPVNISQPSPAPVQTAQTPSIQTETDVEHFTPVPEQQTAPEKKKLSYVEMFQQLSPYKPPTQEQLEEERKKQKREAIFSAIGEGMAAMSNLYFTTQYAPNAFDPSKGMAARTKARFDWLKKEREDNQRLYMDGFMRAMRLDADDERDNRNWQHTIEREKIADHYKEAADARAQAKADRDAAMAKLRMDLMEGKINQQEAAAEAKRIEADYAEAYWQSRINKNNYRRPIGSGSRGGGGQKTSQWTIVNDKTGERRIINASSEANAYSQVPDGWHIRTKSTTDVTTVEEKNRMGNTTISRTTTKTKDGGKGYRQNGANSTKKKTNVNWK